MSGESHSCSSIFSRRDLKTADVSARGRRRQCCQVGSKGNQTGLFWVLTPEHFYNRDGIKLRSCSGKIYLVLVSFSLEKLWLFFLSEDLAGLGFTRSLVWSEEVRAQGSGLRAQGRGRGRGSCRNKHGLHCRVNLLDT